MSEMHPRREGSMIACGFGTPADTQHVLFFSRLSADTDDGRSACWCLAIRSVSAPQGIAEMEESTHAVLSVSCQ